VKLEASYLWRGLPGHPLHPPLTDATIGAYTFATIAGILAKTGQHEFARAWWLALIVALCITVLAALSGLVEWLGITWGSELWKTATLHLTVMVCAAVLFGVAAIVGHAGYTQGEVTTGAFVLTVAGYATLAAGGWLGGAIVFVHGMRVLSLADEPAERAVSPLPHDEKVRAAS
jgi:uncharacterized membrane protein